MKGEEIEEKVQIYDSDSEDYDESNILEENTAAIMTDKVVVLACKWQKEPESSSFSSSSSLSPLPPSPLPWPLSLPAISPITWYPTFHCIFFFNQTKTIIADAFLGCRWKFD